MFASETVTTEAHVPDAETEIVLEDSVEKRASCEILPLKQPCVRSDLTFAWEVSDPLYGKCQNLYYKVFSKLN